MLPSSSQSRFETRAPRRRDRRRGFADLLAVVARGVGRHGDTGSMRTAFEQTLRRVVPVRSVVLRDSTPRWSGHEGVQESELIALRSRRQRSSAPGVLEAAFYSGLPVG